MSSKVPSSSYQGRLLVTEFELDDGPKKQNFLGLVEHRGNKRVRASNEIYYPFEKIVFILYTFVFYFRELVLIKLTLLFVFSGHLECQVHGWRML
jgi:hypothetical protein